MDYMKELKIILRRHLLTHKTERIFERSFEGDDSDIVDVANNTITIPNHFFKTGEKLSMFMKVQVVTQAVGIAETDGFVGVGTTDSFTRRCLCC